MFNRFLFNVLGVKPKNGETYTVGRHCRYCNHFNDFTIPKGYPPTNETILCAKCGNAISVSEGKLNSEDRLSRDIKSGINTFLFGEKSNRRNRKKRWV